MGTATSSCCGGTPEAGGEDTATPLHLPFLAARLYASLAVAWLLGARSLNPDSVDIPGRTTPADAPMPGTVLQAYDAARYAFQEVAARAADDQRARAIEDAAYANGLVSDSLALGGQDTRLSAYAPPEQAADDASLDVTWARSAWRGICGMNRPSCWQPCRTPTTPW